MATENFTSGWSVGSATDKEDGEMTEMVLLTVIDGNVCMSPTEARFLAAQLRTLADFAEAQNG